MAFSPRVVLVPLASSGSAGGRIARIQADASAPGRNEAGLNPKIAELADWHLYEAGAIALGAVRRLHLPHRRLALLQRLWPAAIHPYLSVTNGPDIIGLQAENTESAELGLALAVLMYAGQSSARQVIATGRLDRQAWSEAGRHDDVRVLPVGGIDKKIEALRNSLASQKGAALASQIHFLLPETTLDGADILAQHRRELDGLIVAFKEAGISLEICPVASLRDATSKLGIRFFEVTAADRVATAGLAGAACLVVATAAGMVWLETPIELAYGAAMTDGGERIATPLRAVFDRKEGKYMLADVCIGAQGMPTFLVGDSLMLEVKAADQYGAFGSLSGYQFAVVAVSEQSGVKVLPRETFGPASGARHADVGSAPRDAESADKLLSIVLPIEGPTEENKVIVLARRLFPFDTADLRQELEMVIADEPPAARINAVVSYLAGRAPGYLDYSFISADADVECAGTP